MLVDKGQDPVWWVKNVLNQTNLSPGEIAILRAMKPAWDDNKPIIVPSGHAQGKDYIASCIALWFLYNHMPSKVIFTAPTDRQVKKIMWMEIKKRLSQAVVPLGGDPKVCNLHIDDDWFMLGFTTQETGQSVGKFQGYHSPNMCVIASEAQAIGDTIFEEIEGILTNSHNLFIEIGNPLATTGTFARAIKNTTDNIVIQLNCLESPNYLQRKAVVPGMATYEWVEQKRKAWGEDSPLWAARVLGELPKAGIDTVFSANIIKKLLSSKPRFAHTKRVVSQDVARFGDDETVTYGGVNGQVTEEDILGKNDIPEAANRCLLMKNLINANTIAIDEDGVGGGAYDILRRMEIPNCQLIGVKSNARPLDVHYKNRRAEMWMHAQDQAKKGLCTIPDDKYLIEELSEVRYFFKNGKIQIESKDDIRDRLGRSPDRADAWIMLQWAFKNAEEIRGRDSYGNEEKVSGIGVAASSAMTA